MSDHQTPQKSRWRTVKVFISSTFRDMYAERDHLVKVVFPALREKLGKYRVYLIDIDLRWGVTKEQADNDQVLDLCLDLIDACRPFFIGILGERYGWVPKKFPPEAIRKYGWVQNATGKSLTELEILHGVLNNPQMKGHAFFYLRDPEALSKIPDGIKDIYVESDPVRINKLIVLKEGIRHSGHPVMDPYPAQWEAEAYDRYTKAKGRLTGLKEFGDSIQEQLWERIKGELKLPETPPIETETDPLAVEQDYHERFIDSRLNVYIGRDKIHKDLLAYCNGDDRRPLIVTGPSGSGKSAILARLSRELMETMPPSPLPSPTGGEGSNIFSPLREGNEGEGDVCGSTNEHVGNTTVIPFFVGASPTSTAIRGALQYLCNVIKKKFDIASEIPAEADKLITTFRSFLFSIPENKRLVIIIDAINQLDETGHPEELAWLPDELAPNVRIVLSCIDEPGHKNRFIERAREMKIAEKRVDELTNDERIEIIRKVPSVSAKTLDKDQIKMLLDNPATKNPLYLLIALEELRGFGSFDELNRRISEFPKPDIYPVREGEVSNGDQGGDVIQAIFGQVIRRLEDEFDRELVSTVLPLLASARRGLSEKELSELIVDLSGKDDLFPVLRQLRTYLMERGEIIDFFHRGLYKAIHSLYLKDEDDRKAYHLKLANYFEKKNLDERKVDELPWQWLEAQYWQALTKLLEDLTFVNVAWDRGYYDIEMYWSAAKRHTGVSPYYSYRTIVENPGKLTKSSWQILRLLRDFAETKEHLDTSLRFCDHLIDEERKNGNTDLLRRLLAEKGVLLWGAEDYTAGIAAYNELELLARNCGDHHRLQLALDGQANILERVGENETALAKSSEAEKICRKNHNLPGLQCVLGNRSAILYKLHQFEEALSLLREAEDISRKLGHIDGLITCLPMKVMVTITLAKPDEWNIAELEAPLLEAENISRQFGKQSHLINSLRWHLKIFHAKARALCEQFQWEKALKLFRHIEPICSELKDLNAITKEDSLCIEDMVRCMINCAGISCHKRDHSRLCLALMDEAVQTATKYSLSDIAQPCASVMSVIKQWADYHESLVRWEILSPPEQAIHAKPVEPGIKLTFSGTDANGEPSLRCALTLNEQYFRENHPKVATSLNDLAMLLMDTGRLEDAESMMRRALKINEQHHGKNHPAVAINLNNLALILGDLGRLAEAEQLIRRALAIDELTYGKNHPKISIRLNNLANLLCAAKRLSESEPFYRRALCIDERAYGPSHTEVATDINNLAELFRVTNRLHEAEPLYRRALAIDEKNYGTEHPDVARDLNNLALLLKATARLAEAEPLMQRVVVIYLKFLRTTGHTHTHFQNAINNYARLLMQMGFSQQQVIAKLNELGHEYGMRFGGE